MARPPTDLGHAFGLDVVGRLRGDQAVAIKARRCAKCGTPTGPGHAMLCPGCRGRRGRRSRLDVIRDADRKFLIGHTSRGGRYSWPAGRGSGVPEEGDR